MSGIHWRGEGFYAAEEFERSSVFHFMGTDTGEAERLAASLGYSRPVWIDTEDLPSFDCVIRYD